MALSDRLIRYNALMGRYAFVQLRPVSLAISLFVYLTIITLVFTLNRVSESNLTAFWRNSFVSFAIIQILLLWMMGMYNAGSALRDEALEKSMDFFRLLPMSASQKIMGILVGRNLIILAAGVVNTLFLIICGWLGRVSLLLVFELAVFIWATSATTMLLSLLSSTQEPTQRGASGSKLLLILGVFFLPYIFGLVNMWDEIFPKGAYVPFYSCRLRLFPFLTACAVALALFFVRGLIRRFRDERAPLFSPAGLIIAGLSAHVLSLGLFWPHLKEPEFLPPFCIIMAFFLGTTLGGYRKWDDYLEAFSRKGVLPGWHRHNLSNLVPAAGMILLWAIFIVIANARAGWVLPRFTVPVAVSFWLVLIALAEAVTVYSPFGRLVVLLGWFLVLLYTFLSPIIGAVAESPWFIQFSPFAYLIMLNTTEKVTYAPLVINLWLIAGLLFLIFRRYRAVGPTLSKAGR